MNSHFNTLTLEERIRSKIELSRNSPSIFESKISPQDETSAIRQELDIFDINVKDPGTRDKISVGRGKGRRKKKTDNLNTDEGVFTVPTNINKKAVESKYRSKDSSNQPNQETYSFLASLSGKINH